MSVIDVGPPPPRSHARLWVSTLLLIVYAAFVLLVTMWPQPEQLEFDGIASRVLQALHNFGIPEWFGYDKLEFTANILMFVPLGFLLGLALARKAWWIAIFLLPAFSGGIEYVQGIALEERVSTLLDVLANTIGGYIGLLLAMILRAMIYARDRTKIERELWERRRAAAALQYERAARIAAAGGPLTHPHAPAQPVAAPARPGTAAQPAYAADAPTRVYPQIPPRPQTSAATAAQQAAELDPVTRVLDADFWDSADAPTQRLPF